MTPFDILLLIHLIDFSFGRNRPPVSAVKPFPPAPNNDHSAAPPCLLSYRFTRFYFPLEGTRAER